MSIGPCLSAARSGEDEQTSGETEGESGESGGRSGENGGKSGERDDNGERFHYIGDLPYAQAQLECRKIGRRLPIIKSQNEHTELVNFIRNNIGRGKDKFVRLGLFNTGFGMEYQWDGDSDFSGFTNWNIGEPDNIREHRAVVVSVDDGMWRTREEDDKYPTVCEKDPNFIPPVLPPVIPEVTEPVHCDGEGFFAFKGRCLRTFNDRKNWVDAQRECFKHGARLLVPDSITTALAALKDLQGGNSIKGRKVFIGGAKTLRQDIFSDQVPLSGIMQIERTLVTKITKLHGINTDKFAKRCSGTFKKEDLDADKNCLVLTYQGQEPTAEICDCNDLNSFLCEKTYDWEPEGVEETEWFSLNPGNENFEQEEYSAYQKEIREKKRQGTTCQTPIACQCRKKGDNSKIMDSRDGENPFGVQFESDWACQLVAGDCRIRCRREQQSGRAVCFDVEMKAVCPNSGVISCALQANKEKCEREKKDCLDTPTGATCVARPRPNRSLHKGQCTDVSGNVVQQAKCSATGDPHYTTFDGVAYSFQGRCCYSLLTVCKPIDGLEDFEVQVCNDDMGKTGTTVSWTRSVTVYVGKRKYYFSRNNTFEIDGQPGSTPFSSQGVKISSSIKKGSRSGTREYVLTTDNCNTVTWDGQQNIHVTLNSAYSGRICGLCGNFNSKSDDDFVPRGGTTVVKYNEFGESWLVDDASHNMNNCGAAPEKTCDAVQRALFETNHYCGLLNPDNTNSPFVIAANALTNEDSKKYLATKFDNCVEDHCLVNDLGDLSCSTLEDINAEIIRDLQVTPNINWRTVAGCPLDCSADPGTVFSATRLTCENSCLNLDAENECQSRATDPGCVCVAGKVRDVTGRCVSVEQCKQCIFNKNPTDSNSDVMTLNDGQELVLEPCARKVTCVNKEVKFEQLPACSPDALCLDNKCVCREGFTGDGLTCENSAKPCLEGWVSSGRKCFKVIPRGQTWQDAARGCCAFKAQLARVDNTDDLAALQYFLKANAGTNNRFWVAGNSKIVIPSSRVGSLPSSYDKSKLFVLADENTHLGCYYSDANGQQDVNTNCDQILPSVCEYANPEIEDEEDSDAEPAKKAGVAATRYAQFDVKKTFNDAIEHCKKEGRSLPMVKNMDDLNEISASSDKAEVWVDMQDVTGKGDFRWKDGSAVALKNWDVNEPNNIGKELCGRLVRVKGNFKFRSYNCDAKSVYVLCGPKGTDSPHVWSSPIQVSALTVRTVADILAEQNKKPNGARFSCGKPQAVDCQVRDKTTGQFVPARTLNSKVRCATTGIQCFNNFRTDCSTFRVRFFCPNEENMCSSFQQQGLTPCPGGQQCIPESNGCFSCQCPSGYTMDQNGDCQMPCGQCSLRGDPHFTSYQGQHFNFQGKCYYLLSGISKDVPDSKLPPGITRFQIFTKYVGCNPKRNFSVTCLNRISCVFETVTTSGKKTIVIEKVASESRFKVNGQVRTDTYSVRNAEGKELVTASMRGKTLTIKALGGLQVETTTSSLIVIPPAGLDQELDGICGQCSGTGYKFGNGSVIRIPKVGNMLDPVLIMHMGNSWIQPDPYASDDCPVETEVEPECSGANLTAAQLACQPLQDPTGPFAACFEAVKPQVSYEDCVFDVCQGEDKCVIMKTFSDSCTAASTPVNWRSADRCPHTCDQDDRTEYSSNINCQPRCGDVVPNCRSEYPTDGCRCKQGFFYMDGKCLTDAECGCHFTMSSGEADITMMPGEEVFDTRCNQKVRCVAGGRVEFIPYTKHPQAICTDDQPPAIRCARGYTLNADGNTCDRNVDECAEDFRDLSGRCIHTKEPPQKWRRAVERCNELNATLVQVDTFQKLNDLVAMLKAEGIQKATISGVVRVNRNGLIQSILTKEEENAVEFGNFAVTNFVLKGIRLDAINVNDIPAKGSLFAIAVVVSETGEANFQAFPRSAKVKFVCEQRTHGPEDYEFTPFCSSDNNAQEDGTEYERVSTLVTMEECHMCPVPAQKVRCQRKSRAADGSKEGRCENSNGLLYACDGKDCANMEVSGTCPKDVDECARGLHDCPSSSKCVNTNGAYYCSCSQERPLMVNDECKQLESCSMSGTSGLRTFDLMLRSFTSDSYGALDYNCEMNFASTCQALPSEVPVLEILVDNKRQGNRAEQTVKVGVTKNGVTSIFVFTLLSRLGGYLIVNGENRFPTFTEPQTKVRVASLTDGSVILTDANNMFRISVEPGQKGELNSLRLDLSDDYADKICGLCTMGAANNNRYELDTPELIQEISRGNRQCAPIRPPSTQPPPTTTLRTSTVAFSLPRTTLVFPLETPRPDWTFRTLPPTLPSETEGTVGDVFTTLGEPISIDQCDLWRPFCDRLEALCTIETADCVDNVCVLGACQYLSSAILQNCSSESYSELKQVMEGSCGQVCAENNMILTLGPHVEQPSCSNPSAHYFREHAEVGMRFQCVCDYERGYVLENSACIPRSDCGCRMSNGDYRQDGEKWSAPDCSKDYICRAGEVIETPSTCDKEKTVCVNRGGQYTCECKEGLKGNPYMPNGCEAGKIVGNQTCYLMGMDQEVCYCNDGFAASCDGCQDINECSLGLDNCDKRRMHCVNTVGGFGCECNEGFERGLQGNCVDINECRDPTTCVGEGRACVNFIGKYSCQCCAGYDIVPGGKCERNEQRVPVLPENAPCCATCPLSLCINPTDGPANGCYSRDGLYKNYAEFRFVYEEFCLRRESPDPANWTPGKCPTGVPTIPPGKAFPPAPANTPEAETKPPVIECTPSNACKNMPPLPPSMQGEVCGPTSSSKPKTYPTYCNMLVSLCNQFGGPNKFLPPSSIQAQPGPCPTAATTTTLPPISTWLEPLAFDEWSPWSACVLLEKNIARGCGRGSVYRSREVKSGEQLAPRQALPIELEQESPCVIACLEPPEEYKDQTTAAPVVSCPGPDICTVENKVCGKVGEDTPRTYSSECMLNVTACRLHREPLVVYFGDCQPEDVNPKKFCDVPPLKERRDLQLPENSECVAHDVAVAVCTDRMCRTGSSSTCCEPDDKEEIPVVYICPDGRSQERRTSSALSCKCNDPK